MKKNLLYSAMAFVMALTGASCSQDEILGNEDNGNKTMTMSVSIAGTGANTRALPTVPEGYKLRCVWQVVDSDGNVLTAANADDMFNGVEEVTAENLTITYTKPAANTTAYVLFWADYVKGDINTDNLYKTEKLSAVSYNLAESASTKEGLFNSTVADAFYGKVPSGTQSATLDRPFARINLLPAEEVASQYEAYDQVKVSMAVPAGFNAFTGQALTETKTITYEGDIADADNNVWFSLYAFAGTDNDNLGEGNDIRITLTDTEGAAEEITVTVAGEAVTTTENVHANVNVTPKADNTTDVTVTFPGDLVDPNKPEPAEPLALGDFIYKDGTHGKELNANTIGIVFKLAEGITDEGNYEGKTVAGYAMALCTTTRSKVGSTFPEATLTAGAWADGDYNGFTYSPKFLTAISGSDENTYYTNLTTDYKKDENSTLISDWYVPSAVQIQDICKQVFGFGNTGEFKPAADNAVKAAYEKVYQEVQIAGDKKYGTLLNFGREAAGTFILSSSYDANNGYAISITSTAANTPTVVKQQTIKKEEWGNTSGSIRPVLTIFAAE